LLSLAEVDQRHLRERVVHRQAVDVQRQARPEALRMLVVCVAERWWRSNERRQVDRDYASGVRRGPAQHVLGIGQ
jgi:hypothetical protein